VDPVILASARKHASLTAPSSTPTATRSECSNSTTIGADDAGHALEIGVVVAEGIEFIVHAMPARPKFLR
jgi:hypothetical protein